MIWSIDMGEDVKRAASGSPVGRPRVLIERRLDAKRGGRRLQETYRRLD